jgi:hypothetical protein
MERIDEMNDQERWTLIASCAVDFQRASNFQAYSLPERLSFMYKALSSLWDQQIQVPYDDVIKFNVIRPVMSKLFNELLKKDTVIEREKIAYIVAYIGAIINDQWAPKGTEIDLDSAVSTAANIEGFNCLIHYDLQKCENVESTWLFSAELIDWIPVSDDTNKRVALQGPEEDAGSQIFIYNYDALELGPMAAFELNAKNPRFSHVFVEDATAIGKYGVLSLSQSIPTGRFNFDLLLK